MLKTFFYNARAVDMACPELNPRQIMTITAQEAGW